MCATCGCGSRAEARMINLQTGAELPLDDDHAGDHAHTHPREQDHRGHAHEHRHTHGHHHGDGPVHDHNHGHDELHAHGHRHDDDHHHGHSGHDHAASVVEQLEARVLAKNDRLAARNRGWFEGREILALNIVSSPGAGKTTLLERTIRDLKHELAIFVIEGDQATANDGERIRAAGAAVVQINTGVGCHLEADMIASGLEQLKPRAGSIVLIENVGNLVCPALFDLGEHAKVIVLSVTEGEDKPLKYPHMFRAADLLILNKIDLLPHVHFDVDVAIGNARKVNPAIEIMNLSVQTGEGMDGWYAWLRNRHREVVSLAARSKPHQQSTVA